MTTEDSGRCCCLFRLNRIPGQEHPFIVLDHKQNVSLGRAESCDVTLTESNAVSRCHAILRRTEEDNWTVTDLKSGNGVFVNNVKILPNLPRQLLGREVIELGRNEQNTQAVYYRFQFYRSAKLILQKGVSAVQSLPKCSLESIILTESSGGISELEDEVQGHHTREENLEAELEHHKLKEILLNSVKDKNEKKLQDLEVAQQVRETELCTILWEHDVERERVKEEQKTERDLLCKQLEEKFQKREGEMKESMDKKLCCLEEEKNKMQQLLQKHGTQEVELQSTISQLKTHQLQVKITLDAAQKETQRLTNIGQETKEEMKTTFEDVVESELICAICSELFIKAISLNCSHSYCQLCIEKWLVKKNECPVCRQTVTTHVRSIVLDNYIERLMEILGDDTQEKRKEALEARDNDQKIWQHQKPARGISSKSPRHQGQGQRRQPARVPQVRGTATHTGAHASHGGVHNMHTAAQLATQANSQRTSSIAATASLQAMSFHPFTNYTQRYETVEQGQTRMLQNRIAYQQQSNQNARNNPQDRWNFAQLANQYPSTYHGQNQAGMYNHIPSMIGGLGRNGMWMGQNLPWFTATD